jgi:hypothetical protein
MQYPVSDDHRKKTISLSVPRLKRLNIKNLLLILAVIALIVFAYEYVHTRSQLKQLSNPKIAGQTETQQIINQVSKSLALPTDEKPTLATVNDATKLRNQNFFKSARNGDKVLIYSRTGQALLYRPSTKQVIEFAPISLNGQ